MTFCAKKREDESSDPLESPTIPPPSCLNRTWGLDVGMTDARAENKEPYEWPMRTCPACGKVALIVTERLRDEDIRAVYFQIFGPRGPP